MTQIKNNITLFFLFSFLFFFGFDNHILYERTFSSNIEGITITSYIRYFGIMFSVWLASFILFDKMIKKYPLDKMLPFALMIASFGNWAQFRDGMQNMDFLVHHYITLNLWFNLSNGFLIACIKNFIFDKKHFIEYKKQSFSGLAILLLNIILAAFFTEKNLHLYFLITTFVYILAFFYFVFIFNYQENFIFSNKNFIISVSFMMLFIIIIVSILENLSNSFIRHTFDNLYILYVFIFMLITYKFREKFIKK